MNNISFQGKTNLIFSKDQYKIAKKITENVHRNTNVQHRRSLKHVTAIASDTFSNNLNILLRNNEDGMFIKFNPLNIKKTLNEVENKINLLKSKTGEKLTAWIIGGSSNESTIKVLNECADILCDRPDIDTSILVGLKNPEENFVVRTLKNETSIIFNKPEKTNIDDCFDIVELNNVDIK